MISQSFLTGMPPATTATDETPRVLQHGCLVVETSRLGIIAAENSGFSECLGAFFLRRRGNDH